MDDVRVDELLLVARGPVTELVEWAQAQPDRPPAVAVLAEQLAAGEPPAEWWFTERTRLGGGRWLVVFLAVSVLVIVGAAYISRYGTTPIPNP